MRMQMTPRLLLPAILCLLAIPAMAQNIIDPDRQIRGTICDVEIRDHSSYNGVSLNHTGYIACFLGCDITNANRAQYQKLLDGLFKESEGNHIVTYRDTATLGACKITITRESP